VLDVNPVPVTTIVTADEPTGTSFGVTDTMARGVVTGVVLPPALGDVGVPPQPESSIARRQEEAARPTRPKESKELILIEN
jgi:hypothetical protein